MRKSSIGRTWIPLEIKEYIFERDDYTCQYCKKRYVINELTIDHVIPLCMGGIDELTNYVTSCEKCNQKKGSMKLSDFLQEISVEVHDLPVHGDPIIDNIELPVEFRAIRKEIYNKTRSNEGELQKSKNAQKKLEYAFSREFWNSELGNKLRNDYPTLPRHVIHMLPQIIQIAKSKSEAILLIELAKSANTRNLIGSFITGEYSVVSSLQSIEVIMKNDTSLIKRINWAKERWRKKMKH